MENRDLIEDLAIHLQLNYLSDLKTGYFNKEISAYLSTIDKHLYSAAKWIDLAQYFSISVKDAITKEEIYITVIHYFDN